MRLRFRLSMLVVLFAVALSVWVPQAQASALEGAVTALDARSFAAKSKAVDALEALGEPDALPALRAMLEGMLFREKASKRVVIAEKIGGESPVCVSAR